MSYLKIAQIGQPVLSQKAKPVPEDKIKTPEIQKLIDDLIIALYEEEGVGIAAPQVFESKRIIVITNKNTKNPLTVIINPEITKKSRQKELDWEGCLSVAHGDMRGIVPRHKKISVKGLDRHGKQIRVYASSFKARVIQHEIDHLDGIIFLEKVRSQDMKYTSAVKEWHKYQRPKWPHPRPL